MKTRHSSMATRAASWVARGVTTTTPPILSAGSSRSEFAPTSEGEFTVVRPAARRGGFPFLTRVTNMKIQARILAAALGSLACLAYVNTAAASDHRGPNHPSHHQPRLPGEVIPVEIYDPLGLVAHGPQGQLHLLEDGFAFTEGPAADRHGNVYFTDQPNDKIYRWDAGTGKITLFLEGTGRANGTIFDRDGNLVAAADMHGE